MRLKVSTVIVFVFLLLFPLHINHHLGHSPGFQSSSSTAVSEYGPASFGIIGQNGSTDTYRIQQNITINYGSSLEFLNTIVEFLPNSMHNYSINADGKLILMNSSIIVEDPMDSSIFLNIGGNISDNITGLLMENSTLDFSGHIKVDNTSVRIYNSTIESPFSYPNTTSEDLKYTFSNSHIYSINSSFSGVEMHHQESEFTAGGLNMNNLPLEGSGTFTPLSYWVFKPNALANVVSVSMNYVIGNTTTVSNVTFMIFGRDVYTYHIPAHNLPVSSVAADFNISIENTPDKVSVFNSSSNFSIDLLQSGDQIVLQNINITFLSNDTVSLIGPENFGIYLYNSTWLSYDDNFSLNMNPYYIYSYVPNPGKNAIFLENHSYLYASGMKLSSPSYGGTPPVYVYNDSLAAYFSILSVNQVNQFGNPIQADNNITSSSLNPVIRNITAFWNMNIESMLSVFPERMFQLNERAGSEYYDLLDSLQNGSNSPEFMGDYGDNTLGHVHYFSFNPVESFNFTSLLDMKYTDPYPVLNMSLPNMVSGMENAVNISIDSMQGSSNLTGIKLAVSNSTATVLSMNLKPVIVNPDSEFRQTVNVSPGISIHTGSYRITLCAVENVPFSNSTMWEMQVDRIIYSTAGISTSLETSEDPNGSLSLNESVHGISPYMKGMSPVIYLVKNQNRTVGRKNVTEYFSGSSNQSFRTFFNNTNNGTEVESLVSLPFPDTGHHSSFIPAFSSIVENSAENVPRYWVTLMGMGLSSMNKWYIFNGTSRYESENGTVIINLPNGTYFFSVQSPSGFKTTENSVAFTVHGSEIYMGIYFQSIQFRLDILEVGLPVNTTWEVAIGNLTFETSTGFVQAELKPGTYILNFSSVVYYSSNQESVVVNLTNSSTFIVVHYSYTGGFLGILQEHPEYTFASTVFAVIALLYYLDIRRRSYYPCLSCGTTWPKRNRICPGCGRRMNGRNPKNAEENHK